MRDDREKWARVRLRFVGGVFTVVFAITAGRACYLQVDAFELSGLTDEDSGVLRSVDLNQLDIGLLLPMWAGIPTARRAAKTGPHAAARGAASAP